MPPHCRVTFYDNAHQIHRTLDVQVGLPLVAAERALQWLLENHIAPEDLDKAVKVEVVTTTECNLGIEIVEGRAQITAAKNEIAKAA